MEREFMVRLVCSFDIIVYLEILILKPCKNVNASWMGDSYIDLSPMRHEPLPDLYKVCNSEEELEAKMREIATQEKLNDAFVVNMSIGKVVYTKFGQLNFNLSVNNLLNNKNIQTHVQMNSLNVVGKYWKNILMSLKKYLVQI